MCPHLVEVPHAVAAAALELVRAVEDLLQQGKGQGTSDTTQKVLSGVSAQFQAAHMCGHVCQTVVTEEICAAMDAPMKPWLFGCVRESMPPTIPTQQAGLILCAKLPLPETHT